MPQHQADVVIIGGGIVGLSTALELQERGKRVALVDPGAAVDAASFGNAGVISRGSIFPMAAPALLPRLPSFALGRDVAVRVRLSSLPSITPWTVRFLAACNERAWRSTAAALNPMVALAEACHLALAEKAGATHMIKHDGYLRVYRNAGAAVATRVEREVLDEHGIETQILDARQIADLEPLLAKRFGSGLFFPGTSSVQSPGELVESYRRAFVGRGGVVVPDKARNFKETGDIVTVTTSRDSVTARWAVLCAGAWSARFAAKLGYRIPLAAERGYHTHLVSKGNACLLRPVFDVAGGYVMSPMGNGRLRILSGVELGRPQDPPRYGQINQVVDDARHSIAFDTEGTGEYWMGSRPSTPDGLPVIGRAHRHKNLFFAFGHGHIGFANGPITGQLVAKLINDEPLPISLQPFSPARFG